MSRAADAIKQNLKRYVDHMTGQGKKPTALYVTKAQFDILRADAKHPGNDYRPRFMGIEVKKHDG